MLDRSPLPQWATGLLLVGFTNVLIYPVSVLSFFAPVKLRDLSGIGLFYVLIWSGFAAIVMMLLSTYSRRIKSSLAVVGQVFGLEQKESDELYFKLNTIITGRGCLFSGLVVGFTALGLGLFWVIPSMVSGGWYTSEAIHLGFAGQIFFDYMLAGSAIWMLASYAVVINRLQVYSKRLPQVDMLHRLRVFGVTSLRGAVYFEILGGLALVYFVGTDYFRISWGPPVLWAVTIFAVVFPMLFFFGSLMGIHNVIVSVKEHHLNMLRTDYWRVHLALQRSFPNARKVGDHKNFNLRLSNLRELDSVIRWLERVPNWPFDLGILRLLAISVIFPIASSFLGNYVIGILMHP